MSTDTSPIEQRTPHSQNIAPSPASSDSVMLQLIREMREQRQALQTELQMAASERKSERRWKLFFQGLFFLAPLIVGGLYFLFFLNSTGFKCGPFSDVVGVVHFDCQISPGSPASADAALWLTDGLPLRASADGRWRPRPRLPLRSRASASAISASSASISACRSATGIW